MKVGCRSGQIDWISREVSRLRSVPWTIHDHLCSSLFTVISTQLKSVAIFYCTLMHFLAGWNAANFLLAAGLNTMVYTFL